MNLSNACLQPARVCCVAICRSLQVKTILHELSADVQVRGDENADCELSCTCLQCLPHDRPETPIWSNLIKV